MSLVADLALYRQLRALLVKVPIATMPDDYSGLICLGCNASGSEPCATDCWVPALERLGSRCEEILVPDAWVGLFGCSLTTIGYGPPNDEKLRNEFARWEDRE